MVEPISPQDHSIGVGECKYELDERFGFDEWHMAGARAERPRSRRVDSEDAGDYLARDGDGPYWVEAEPVPTAQRFEFTIVGPDGVAEAGSFIGDHESRDLAEEEAESLNAAYAAGEAEGRRIELAHYSQLDLPENLGSTEDQPEREEDGDLDA